MSVASGTIADLHALDGLSVKDAENLPHPTYLSGWERRGWYTIDADKGVFRLTPAGKAMRRFHARCECGFTSVHAKFCEQSVCARCGKVNEVAS